MSILFRGDRLTVSAVTLPNRSQAPQGAAPDTAVVAFRGEFAIESLIQSTFRDPVSELVNRGIRYVLYDLSRVTFIDSFGFRLILNSHRRLIAVCGMIALVTPDEPEQPMLKLILSQFKLPGGRTRVQALAALKTLRSRRVQPPAAAQMPEALQA